LETAFFLSLHQKTLELETLFDYNDLIRNTYKGETMKTLETLKAQAEMLQNKALMYYNEMGDEDAYNRIQIELKSVNARILDLMTEEQENSVKQAIIA
jgi:hypothetical protein